MNLGQLGPFQVLSSICSRREPLRISGTQILWAGCPNPWCKNTKRNTKHYTLTSGLISSRQGALLPLCQLSDASTYTIRYDKKCLICTKR